MPPIRPILRRWLPYLLFAFLASAQARDRPVLAGVNLAGAEFNSARKPGVANKDYVFPRESDFAYFAAQGMNAIRLPLLWERLQPQAGGAFDADYFGKLTAAVAQARRHDLQVVLDVHNYARYQGRRLGDDANSAAALADLWRRLAKAFGKDGGVLFGLMNEPHGIDAPSWAKLAQAAIDAIRATGARNWILVPGTAWSGAHSWHSTGYGVPNSKALLAIRDPAGRIAFEVHQYLDADFSGTSPDCVSERIGVEKMRGFTAWLREHRKLGFLGEFGVSRQPACLAALDGLLAHIEQHRDLWLGWTYWAAGAWWKPDYPFSVQPRDGQDPAPQLRILSRRAKALID